jgi:hypothetical protein
MKLKYNTAIVFLLALVLLSTGGLGLRTYSGDSVLIETPVDDDIFAAGSAVTINAPVNSVTAVGGTLNINAPVKGDVFVAGGQIHVNSDVGGKLVVAGGNVFLDGNVGTNLVAAGGQIDILPGKTVNRDALIAGGSVANAGRVNGTLTVSSNQFSNTGSAGKVDFRKVEDNKEEPIGARDRDYGGFNVFGLLTMLGYFILGLILVRYLPCAFTTVDREVRDSPVLKTLLGFVLIIASVIAILLVAVTVVGLPIALISTLLFAAALMLTGIFVSYSVGKWIGERLKLKYGSLILFAVGFVVLNILFLLPFVGGLISTISMSLGFAAFLYAAHRFTNVSRAVKVA